jgi:hypothetical protein
MAKEVVKVSRDEMQAYRGCRLEIMGVRYRGQKERGGFKFDMFNDLETGVVFTRMKKETVMEAADRVRTAYQEAGRI